SCGPWATYRTSSPTPSATHAQPSVPVCPQRNGSAIWPACLTSVRAPDSVRQERLSLRLPAGGAQRLAQRVLDLGVEAAQVVVGPPGDRLVHLAMSCWLRCGRPRWAAAIASNAERCGGGSRWARE